MNTGRKLNKRRFWWTATIAVVATYALTAWGVATGGGVEDVLTITEVAQQTAIYGTLIAVVLVVLILVVMTPRGAVSSDKPKRQIFSAGSDVVDEIAEERRERQSRNFGMWGTDNDLPPPPSMDGF